MTAVQASPSRACCLEQILSIFSDMHGLEYKNDKKDKATRTGTKSDTLCNEHGVSVT